MRHNQFAPLRKKPLPRMSKKRQREYRIWKQVEQEIIDEHPFCEACPLLNLDESGREQPSREGHHVRGRVGKLYTYKPFIMAVCRPCHNWIHSNRKVAIDLGLLAGPGEWGKQPS